MSVTLFLAEPIVRFGQDLHPAMIVFLQGK